MAKEKSVPQVKKIWAVAKELGLDEESLRDVVAASTQQRHISALTRQQARAVIDQLELLAGRTPNLGYSRRAGMSKDEQNDEVIYIVSPAECDKIQNLREQLGWTEAELTAFIRKMYQREDLRYLRQKEAHGVICAMESMLKRKADSKDEPPDKA